MAKVKEIEIVCPVCGTEHVAYRSEKGVEIKLVSGEYNCSGCGTWIYWKAGKVYKPVIESEEVPKEVPIDG